MALHTRTTIRINGHQELAGPFASLELTESITDHHRFRLVLPARRLGADAGPEAWPKLVGTRITIEIAPRPAPTGAGSVSAPKGFSGLITGVALGQADGPGDQLILTGGSPTLLLDDAPHTASFSGQPLRRIVESRLAPYPANLLRPRVNPATREPIGYTVQYKENTWQYLRRLGRTHGEWFYYDGQQVVFGRRHPATVRLTHGVSLDRFALQMEVRAGNMAFSAYDYGEDAPAIAATGAPAAGNAYSRATAAASRSLFPRRGRYPTGGGPLPGRGGRSMQKVAARHQAGAAAQMVHLRGHSHHPALGVGHHIAVEAGGHGTQPYGPYMLTGVRHRCSSEGDYQNTFEGVPAEAAAPPHRLGDHPLAETQSAVVVANNDPADLGRVQVRLRWQHGRTPWLRMAGPAGGAGKGVYMIPEKGEEVLVGFAGGHPARPYVLGTGWNGGARAGLATPGNDIKAIRTRSGHTIELNDAAGGERITITDRKNNTILIDTAESNIDITAQDTLTVNARHLKFNVSENMEVSVGKNKRESIGKKQMLSAKSSVVMIDEASQMQAREILRNAGEITLNSTEKNMELSSAKKIVSNSGEKNILN